MKTNNTKIVGPSVAHELKNLNTPYTKATLNVSVPLPEYPRPQLKRSDDSWFSLNGIWSYAIRKGALSQSERVFSDVVSGGDRTTSGTVSGGDRTTSGTVSGGKHAISDIIADGDILVPYSPECFLSGVSRRVLPDEVFYYRRNFSTHELPFDWRNGRTLLHFGAVDQSCRVYCNGLFVREHHGGYFSFTCDLTDLMQEGMNQIFLEVVDPSQTGPRAYGKQTLERGKIWYSPSSGIWQSVWLEQVPSTYIKELRITPDLELGRIEVVVQINETIEPSELSGYVSNSSSNSNSISNSISNSAQAHTPFSVAEGTAPLEFILSAQISDPHPWSPEDPFLYDFVLELGKDRCESYFGLRSFGLIKDAFGIPRLTLNDKPYPHLGVLDQGYWSDGMYTPPSDQAMIDDILNMKKLGFNMLRKHIKIEPARWYYHCDRLGMLVWQDMVSGGGPYHFPVIGALPFIGVKLRDTWGYSRFGRKSSESREIYWEELDRTVNQLYSVTSLALWVPFNEAWGQFESSKAYERIWSMDKTRPIDHASGWHDQGAGDLQSLHIYFKKLRLKPDGSGRPLALTEFGGFSYSVPNHCSSDRSYGYKPYQDLESYQAGVLALFDELWNAAGTQLAALVYTQLSDVEDEINGLLTYDRQVNKWPLDSSAALALKSKLDRYREIKTTTP